MRSRLDLLDTKFANKIWSIKNKTSLRVFAYECANLAYIHCGNGDQRSLEALEICIRYIKNEVNDKDLNQAYRNAESAAVAADDFAFESRNALELGGVSENDYHISFSAARAAYSTQECCNNDEMVAAHEAAYEAWSALTTMLKTGSTLNGLVASNDNDTTIISIFEDILLRLNSME